MADHYDLPWKEALDRLLRPFLGFFFPEVHEAIDWSEEPENLETELQRLSRDATVGDRRADKLFRVRLISGERAMLLLHIEVQTTVDHRLPERILVYWYRIYDHYGERPISLVLLGDEHPAWRPNRFVHERLGFRLELEYPVAKLLDHPLKELETSDNPVALAAMAYFLARATSGRPAARVATKLELVQLLLDKGFEDDLADQVFRLIDWMLILPVEAEREFRQRVEEIKERSRMRYVTSLERFAREEGLEEGLQKGLQEGLQEGLQKGLQKGLEDGRKGQAALIHRLLELRFGAVSADQAALLANADLGQLSRWGERVVTAATLDEVFAAG